MKLVGRRPVGDLTLPREQGEGPLRWLKVSTRSGPSHIHIYCDRGHGTAYSGDISDEGQLHDVVQCAECGWEASVTLKGWRT